MNKQQYELATKMLEELKEQGINSYDLMALNTFNIWAFELEEKLSKEENQKIQENKLAIVGNWTWLSLKIEVEEDDLMLFIIFTTLSNRNLAEFNKWKIADFLEYTTYANGVLDREAIEEIIEEINELDLSVEY